MEKGKTIRFRVSDSFYNEINKLAADCNESLSNLTREMVKLGIKGWDDQFIKEYPLNNSRFLLLIGWIYSQRESLRDKKENISLKLVTYHKITLDNYINHLDTHFKKLFNNVRVDIDRIVKGSDESTNIITLFGIKDSTCYFDYDLFEKYLLHKSLK